MPSTTTLMLALVAACQLLVSTKGQCGEREKVFFSDKPRWCAAITSSPSKCNNAYTEKTEPFKKCLWNDANSKCVLGGDCPKDCIKINKFGEGIISLANSGGCELNAPMTPGSTCNVKCDEKRGYSAKVGTYICPEQGDIATTSLRCTMTTTTITITTTTTTTTTVATTATTATITPVTTTTTATTTAATTTITSTRASTSDVSTTFPTATTATTITSRTRTANAATLTSTVPTMTPARSSTTSADSVMITTTFTMTSKITTTTALSNIVITTTKTIITTDLNTETTNSVSTITTPPRSTATYVSNPGDADTTAAAVNTTNGPATTTSLRTSSHSGVEKNFTTTIKITVSDAITIVAEDLFTAAIAAGVIVFIFLIIITVVFICKRKNQQSKLDADTYSLPRSSGKSKNKRSDSTHSSSFAD